MEQDFWTIGNYIGEYKVEKVIGRGTYGAVYLATKQSTGELVAIKSLDFSPDIDRFINEVRQHLLLRNEYILPILGFDLQARYIVMAYAPNDSLYDYLKMGRMRYDQALIIIQQVGKALHYAHLQRPPIVHRDLKPANILFNAKGEAQLADFGIALALENGITKRVNVIEGTYAYMAPEEFSSEVSTRSDQYALACIAYELLTGERPINPIIPDNTSDTIKFTMWKNEHETRQPKPLRKYNSDISEQIEDAILKALAKKRQDRYPDVHAFLVAMGLTNPTNMLSVSTLLNTAAQFRSEGHTYFLAGRYAEALQAFLHSLELEPDHAETYHSKGQVLRELKRYEEALLAYQQAIKLAPDRDIFHNCMGLILCELNSYDGYLAALDAFKRAIELSPSKEVYYVNRGDAFCVIEDYKAAIYAYDETIRRSINRIVKGKAYAHKAEALFKLAGESRTSGSLVVTAKAYEQQAFLAYEEAIKVYPDVSYYLAKGQAHFRRKQFKEAHETYLQGLKDHPGNQDLQDRLGPSYR